MTVTRTTALSPAAEGMPTGALSAAEHDALRQALERSRDERREQLLVLDAEPGELSADPVAAAHRESVAQIVADVERALARMDAGTYGICTGCGSAIPLPRLELVPHTSGCVDCLQRQAAEH